MTSRSDGWQKRASRIFGLHQLRPQLPLLRSACKNGAAGGGVEALPDVFAAEQTSRCESVT
jgi:hypothetical protein